MEVIAENDFELNRCYQWWNSPMESLIYSTQLQLVFLKRTKSTYYTWSLRQLFLLRSLQDVIVTIPMKQNIYGIRFLFSILFAVSRYVHQAAGAPIPHKNPNWCPARKKKKERLNPVLHRNYAEAESMT